MKNKPTNLSLKILSDSYPFLILSFVSCLLPVLCYIQFSFILKSSYAHQLILRAFWPQFSLLSQTWLCFSQKVPPSSLQGLPTLHAFSLFWWIPVSSNVQAYLFVNSLAKFHVPSEWFPHIFIVLLSKDILFYMVIICLYLSHSSLKVLSTLKCPDDQFLNIPLVNPMLCSCRHWIKALGGQKGQTLSKKQKSFWLKLF